MNKNICICFNYRLMLLHKKYLFITFVWSIIQLNELIQDLKLIMITIKILYEYIKKKINLFYLL